MPTSEVLTKAQHAVAHALEGATARSTSPAGLLYGLEALRILSDALPRVVADELEADWEKVKIEQAPSDKRLGDQNTDGSRSIRWFYSLSLRDGFPLNEKGPRFRGLFRAIVADGVF